MKPEIVEQARFLVVGVRHVGGLGTSELRAVWEDSVLPRLGEIPVAPGKGRTVYGVFGVIPGHSAGAFEYVAGAAPESMDSIPAGMVAWMVPAGLYAVVEVEGLGNIERAYTAILETWLPKSGYHEVKNPAFTVCRFDVTPTSERIVWRVHVPVRDERDVTPFDFL